MPNHTVTSDYVIEIRQLDVKASLIEKQSEALGASGATRLHFLRVTTRKILLESRIQLDNFPNS